MGYAYLSNPFNHVDPSVRAARVRQAARAAARLFMQGRPVFCPIAHNALLIAEGCRQTYPEWVGFNSDMLRNANALLVLQLPGWDVSFGVKGEIAEAERLGLPIEYLDAALADAIPQS